jgi:hypothetical protein
MVHRVRKSLGVLAAENNLSRDRLPNQETKSIHPHEDLNASIKETQRLVLIAFHDNADVFRGFRVGFSISRLIHQEKSYVQKSLMFYVSACPHDIASSGPGYPQGRSIRRLLVVRRELSWLECLCHGKCHPAIWNRCRP